MATTTKLNIDRATVRQLFKAVTKATDEINEKSIVHGQVKRVLPLQHLAQASEFYVPNSNHGRIALTTNGHPDIRAWSDRELVNTKSGWESLGLASSCLLSEEKERIIMEFIIRSRRQWQVWKSTLTLMNFRHVI